MARCVLLLLLPTLLSLSLLADAGYNLVHPGEQEVDNPLVLHDAFEQNPLRLPSEKKETIKDVPLLVRRPWDRYQVSSTTPGQYRSRAENEESEFEPRERAFERIGAREPNHPHGYEKHEYLHGGEKKFEQFREDGPREDHLHFRPQFPRPSFPFSEQESVSSSFGSFPREFRPRPENEESGFEMAFKPFGKRFPEREHHYPHHHGQDGREWEFLEFPRGEDHNHGRYHERHEYPHGGEMKFRHRDDDHFHFRPQFPRPSRPFPCSGDHGKEAISSSFRSFPGEFHPENEKPGFEPRETAFESIGKGFPEREHNHPHGHGQGPWEWEFPNEEEHKQGRHEKNEYPHGGEMKFKRFWGDGPRGDHFRSRPQFPRPSSFPSSGDYGKEGITSSFGSFHGGVRPRAENEKFGFQSRERAFEHIVGKPGFPDKQHSHGQRSFLDREEHKHEGHKRHEDQAAQWTDWVKSLLRGH